MRSIFPLLVACAACGLGDVGDVDPIRDDEPATGDDPVAGAMAAQVIVETPRTFRLAGACEPGVTLCEVSAAVGLHDASPAYGRGASVVDVDGDGLEDLWQGHARNTGLGADRGGILWRNLGDGTFAPLDLGIPLPHFQHNWGATWADYDDDGDPDVLLTNGGYDGLGELRLYRNDLATTGSFTDVTLAAGIDGSSWAWWGGAFADFDRDGRLDLVVAARSIMSLPPCCAHPDRADELPPPVPIEAPLQLYRNLGDGVFREVGAALGLAPMEIDAHLPVWWDYDADGWPDLFVPNMGDWSTYATDAERRNPDESRIRLYRNLQGEGFEDVTDAVLPAWLRSEGPVFGVAPLDVDQDGLEDLYVGRAWLQAGILRSRGDGTLEVLAGEAGLDNSQDPRAPENTMGLNVGDLTGDGFPEIFVGPGSPNLQGLPVVYRHTGRVDGRLYERQPGTRPAHAHGQHRGSALGDLDQDGDVDLFWNMGGFGRYDEDPFDLPPGADPNAVDSRQQPLLFANQDPAPATAAIRLRGTRSSRDPIGARVRVEGSAVRWYAVQGTVGFQSRNSPWLTVALGSAEEATVTVSWPSGQTTVNRVERGARVWLVEP